MSKYSSVILLLFFLNAQYTDCSNGAGDEVDGEDDLMNGGGGVGGGGGLSEGPAGALFFTRRAPLPAVKVSEDEITRKLLVKLA